VTALSAVLIAINIFGASWATSASVPEQRSAVEPSLTEAAWFSLLTEKIRQAAGAGQPLEIPDPLFVGGYFGGEFLVSAIEIDPLMPDTLDVYFDQWNAAARGHLLLAYARSIAEVESFPNHVGTLADEERTAQRLHDAEDRSRITILVERGGYAEAWNTFVRPVQELITEFEGNAEQQPDDPWELFLIVDEAAKRHGLHELVRGIEINPEHVAGEMLRLVRQARLRKGLDPSAQDVSNEQFIYWCDSLGNGVQVKSWHPLFDPFQRAYAGEKDDTRARDVMNTFRSIGTTFAGWLEEHPDANGETREKELHRIAGELAFFDLLEAYGRAEERSADQ
jgi:hypothetical protein